MMDPRDAIESEQLDALNRAFSEQLMACLDECARGRRGLFAEPIDTDESGDTWPEAARLRELAQEVRTATGTEGGRFDLESLERTLTVLEEKLFAALTAAAPEEILVKLKEHAARELAPYRSRMGVVQLRQVEHQFVTKQLLAHYGLPRLSLFYMSQQ